MEESRKENGDPALPDPSTGLTMCEVYFAKRGLSTVPDLSRFRQLRYIWLNDNRIKDVNGNMFNCCVAELYLQNNKITSVSGALKHLTCLKVLLLHNNQLKNLEETVAELRNTQSLETANFFLNPFTQDLQYRQYVIHHLQSVRILDRREVRQGEKTQAFRLFSAERQRTLDRLAFGRRALSPPAGRKVTRDAFKLRGSFWIWNCRPFPDREFFRVRVSAGPSGSRKRRPEPSDEMENPSEGRTIMQFSTLDWCGMRAAQLEEESPTAANILTIKFT